MIIPVKPLKQKKDDCGKTCAMMILNYYGAQYTEAELDNFYIKETPSFSINGFMTDDALFFIRKGLDVECLSYNLYYNEPDDAKLSTTKLIKKLQDKQRNLSEQHYARLIESTVRLLKDDGGFKIEQPSMKALRRYLRKGIPLIAHVSYPALHGKAQEDLYQGHAVVLVGISKDKISLIDPNHACVEEMPVDQFMFGMLSSRVMTTTAYLLAVKPKKGVNPPKIYEWSDDKTFGDFENFRKYPGQVYSPELVKGSDKLASE